MTVKGYNIEPGADLICAKLKAANLYRANLCRANLYNTDLSRANFYGANLSKAINIPVIPMSCPDTGEFIGYKKAGNFIVKLKIPSDAKRSSATGRKCRTNKAIVLEIQHFDGSKVADRQLVASDYDKNFIYEVGGTIKVENFDDNRWHECASGIHFFITREEAVQYNRN